MDHFIIGARGTHVRETGLTRIDVNMVDPTVIGVVGHSYVKLLDLFFYCKTQCTRTCVSMKMYTKFVFQVGKV